MHMQFTSEEAGDDGSTPFLDILITPDKAGNLTTTLYRKPIHMNLYLQWDSNHTVASKYSVVDSLQHRANTISSNADLLKTAQKHLQAAVERCKYLAWAMNTANMKTRSATNKSRTRKSNASSNIQKPHMVIPYYQGMSDSLQKTWRAYGVQVYFQGGHTIKNVLMAPKDQDAIHNKSGIIYIYITVIGWSVMRSILLNPLELLMRGLRKILRHPAPSMTIITPLVRMSL